MGRSLITLGVLLLASGCDSRPVVVLGSRAPHVDAGTRASAGREAEDDDTRTGRSERSDPGD